MSAKSTISRIITKLIDELKYIKKEDKAYTILKAGDKALEAAF